MSEEYVLVNAHLEGESFQWPAGPAGVLLCHGFTATTAEVRPLARHLLEAGYTVAGPLLPGHGTSPVDLNRTPWTAWAQAAEEAYQRVGAQCAQVIVGGESMGALLALLLASRHPEVAGVMAYAPALRLSIRPVDRVKLALLAPFVLGRPKGHLDSATLWQGYPINPLKGILQLLRLQSEVRKHLAEISQPILVVQGRLDTSIDRLSGAMICQGVRSTHQELHWMEKSSHTVILDRELEAVAALTLAFIQRALA